MLVKSPLSESKYAGAEIQQSLHIGKGNDFSVFSSDKRKKNGRSSCQARKNLLPCGRDEGILESYKKKNNYATTKTRKANRPEREYLPNLLSG